MARLILDTCVLIAGVRGRVDLATGRAVVTTDERARFGELPDVTARLVSV